MERKKKKEGFYEIDEDSDFPVHEKYTKEEKRKILGDELDRDEEE